jgi:hypothetical protein
MSISAEEAEAEAKDFKFRKGANWIPENVKTLMQWVHISAIYIDILGESTKMYKRILRGHTILNLSLSSLAGTVSLSQFNISEAENPKISLFLKVVFTIMTIVIALSNGYLKVYEIQEKLEKQIRLQQQWIQFGSTITSELQLPVDLRKDALYLIMTLNDTYTALFKNHIVANRRIMKHVAAKNGLTADNLTLSDLFERIVESEGIRLKIIVDPQESKPERQHSFLLTTQDSQTDIKPPLTNAKRTFSMYKAPSKRIQVDPTRKQITQALQKPSAPAMETDPFQEVLRRDPKTAAEMMQAVKEILDPLEVKKRLHIASAAAAKARSLRFAASPPVTPPSSRSSSIVSTDITKIDFPPLTTAKIEV